MRLVESREGQLFQAGGKSTSKSVKGDHVRTTSYYEKDKQSGKLAVYRGNRKRVVAERKARLLACEGTAEDHAAVERERTNKAERAAALKERLQNGTASEKEIAAQDKKRLRQQQWVEKNKEHVAKRSREWKEKNPDKVKDWNARWRRENGQCAYSRKKEWIAANPEEHAARVLHRRNRLRENPAKFLLRALGSKGSALTVEDIHVPTTCPLLGVPLVISPAGVFVTKCSPSVDRIDSTKGYTKDNIWVISHLANTMKNSASKLELRTFCTNALRLLEDGCLASMSEQGGQSA